MKTRLIILFGSLLYRILGGRLCSVLAHSWLGKFTHQIISGPSKQFKIFSTKEGIKVKLDIQDALSLGIIYLGTINKNETEVLKTIIKQGDIVIDIGAYVDGWYTLLAAKLIGSKGHVYTFEPHPMYYRRLKENVRLNRFTNTTLEQLGVFDKSGSIKFYEAKGASSLIKSQALANTRRKPKEMTIRAVILDEYIKVRNIDYVSLIKIDVEGAEMSVLRGANRLLQSKKAPDLVVEVFDMQLRRGGSSEVEVLSYLKHFGYKPYMFTPDGLATYNGKQNTTLNLFFSKKYN